MKSAWIRKVKGSRLLNAADAFSCKENDSPLSFSHSVPRLLSRLQMGLLSLTKMFFNAWVSFQDEPSTGDLSTVPEFGSILIGQLDKYLSQAEVQAAIRELGWSSQRSQPVSTRTISSRTVSRWARR